MAAGPEKCFGAHRGNKLTSARAAERIQISAGCKDSRSRAKTGAISRAEKAHLGEEAQRAFPAAVSAPASVGVPCVPAYILAAVIVAVVDRRVDCSPAQVQNGTLRVLEVQLRHRVTVLGEAVLAELLERSLEPREAVPGVAVLRLSNHHLDALKDVHLPGVSIATQGVPALAQAEGWRNTRSGGRTTS